MIRAKDISKTYTLKKRISVLKKERISKEAAIGINIEIPPGKIIGLLGVNGAGKTTTIKMLTTMIEPTSGEIWIDDIDAVKNPMKAKEIINLITGGERNIYWRLTAKENLQYFGRLYGLASKELEKRITDILTVVDLMEVKDIPVEQYSKGMKQRLQIARGLINNPKYVFLDEPTLGLDIVIASELRKYIKKLAEEQGKGILLTTHYITEAEELCDYVYIIDRGRIIASGNTSEIKEKYAERYRAEFQLNCINNELRIALENLQSVGVNLKFYNAESKFEIISKTDLTGKIIELIENSDCVLKKVIAMEPSLEDTMLMILGDKRNEKSS